MSELHSVITIKSELPGPELNLGKWEIFPTSMKHDIKLEKEPPLSYLFLIRTKDKLGIIHSASKPA